MDRTEYIEGFKIQYAIRLDKAMKDNGVTAQSLGINSAMGISKVERILRGDHDQLSIEHMGWLLWLCEHGGE